MCRMMAVVGGGAAVAPLLSRFRAEASDGRVARGAQPGHVDGWGIAFAGADGALHHAGRSIDDASRDPTYAAAVERVGAAPRVALAHVRKATRGSRTLDNTHPFIERGYAFAHNGTVDGIAKPGENDSRVLFARILGEIEKGASVVDAIARLARDVDAHRSYTSLTILLTDGASLWGLRRVGNDPVACAPEACPADYYTLGYAALPQGGIVVSQEHEILGLAAWTPVGDGELLHVGPNGHVAVTRVLAARS